MAFAAQTMLSLLLYLLWTLLNNKSWSKSVFRLALKSEDFISEQLTAAGFVFAPGLFSVLQHSSPPSISWFESLPATIPAKAWGVYAITLSHQTLVPILYIGSGTAAQQGVKQRLQNYDDEKLLPSTIDNALELGYTITHKAMLVHCPLPTAAAVPLLRTVIIAIEAALCGVFSAFENPVKVYGSGDICPWPRSQFEYDYKGGCSHSPLLESQAVSSLTLTAEELETAAAATAEKNRLYQIDYQRDLRANPTEKFRERTRTNNKKQKAGTAIRQKEAIESQTY